MSDDAPNPMPRAWDASAEEEQTLLARELEAEREALASEIEEEVMAMAFALPLSPEELGAWAVAGVLPNAAAERAQTIAARVAAIVRNERRTQQPGSVVAQMLRAVEEFTAGAHAARTALNAAGLPCPGALALAAELARNALRAAREPRPATSSIAPQGGIWTVSRNLQIAALQLRERTAAGRPLSSDEVVELAEFLRRAGAAAAANGL